MPFLAPGNPFAAPPQPMPPPTQYVPGRGQMPVPPWFFPWMFGMQQDKFPRPQDPRFGPLPRSLLDRHPDLIPELNPGMLNPGMRAQPVADIYSFTKKGLLGVPGTEGAGGRGLGSRGGGLLGGRYNFRDPSSVAQYEKDRGLPPGSIKPVEAQVTTIAPPGGGPQRDFGKYNAKVTDPRMLTPEARREAGIDAAMRKAQMGHDAETARRIAGRRDLNAARIQQQEGPTTAQMARPVKPTREIMDKLAAARAARAASEGMRLVEDARAWMGANKGKKPFDSKVLADRYNKMDVDQQEIFSRIMFKDEPWFPYR